MSRRYARVPLRLLANNLGSNPNWIQTPPILRIVLLAAELNHVLEIVMRMGLLF
jgi:hypothetical protein